MFENAKKFKINFRRNYKVLSFASLGLLTFCFLFLTLADDESANIVAAFIYLFLVLLVILQIFEYLWHPEHFQGQEPFRISTLTKRINLLKLTDYRQSYQKRYWRWQKVVNLFLLVAFFVTFGVTASLFNNFWVLGLLISILALVNFFLFYYDFADPDNFITKKFGRYLKNNSRRNYDLFRTYFSKRNNVLITIVNLCVVSTFLIWFDLDLRSYSKILAFAFILFITNSVLMLDAKNDEEYS